MCDFQIICSLFRSLFIIILGQGGGHFSRGQYNNQYNRGFGYRGSNKTGQPVAREKLKFDDDYDFEKANEQFSDVLEGLKDVKIAGMDVLLQFVIPLSTTTCQYVHNL